MQIVALNLHVFYVGRKKRFLTETDKIEVLERHHYRYAGI